MPKAQKQAVEETPERPVETEEAASETAATPTETEAAPTESVAAPTESSPTVCGVCGSNDVVFTQSDPWASPASWCARHLPDNLRTQAMEADRGYYFNLEGRRAELDAMTRDDLYQFAQVAEIEGRSSMSKEDLVEAVLRHELSQRGR